MLNISRHQRDSMENSMEVRHRIHCEYLRDDGKTVKLLHKSHKPKVTSFHIMKYLKESNNSNAKIYSDIWLVNLNYFNSEKNVVAINKCCFSDIIDWVIHYEI